MRKSGLFTAGVLALMLALGLILAGCDTGNDGGGISGGNTGGNTGVTFNSITANGSATQTTTELTLVFSQAITGLSASDITLSGVSGVIKGTLNGSGPTYTLGISGFTSGGTLSVAAVKSGYDISGSPKTAAIYYYNAGDTIVTLNSVTANGSATQTTTQLTLTFSQAITGLSAEDITLSGVPGVSKGTLNGSGPTYTLGISGFTSGGTLSVAVFKSGYAVNGSPKTVTIYYSSGSDGGNSGLIAKWYTSQNNADADTSVSFEFTANGTLLLYGNSVGLTYTNNSNTITISLNGNYLGTASYVMSGTKLTLSNVGSDVANLIPAGDYYKKDGNNSDIGVLFDNIFANGDEYDQNTTQLTLYFDRAIPGLTANDIILSGINDISKGTLSGSGPEYTLNISGFNSSGTLSVAVAKTGYNIIGSPKTVTIYRYGIPVEFTQLTANGSSSETTTRLTLYFANTYGGDTVSLGLSVNDITLSGVNGVIKGTLTPASLGQNIDAYYLNISGFTSSGTLSVSAGKPGYIINASPQTVAIYYFNTNFALASVTANGSPTQTTTQLTLIFDQAVPGLTASDITLSGASVYKGSLSGSGPIYYLGISDVSSNGTLNVAVAKSGYTITGSPKTATIYYYYSPPPPPSAPGIPTLNVSKNGNNLTLTWSFPSSGGRPDSILVRVMNPGSSQWATVETLSGTATSYTFAYPAWVDSDGVVRVGIIGTNTVNSASAGVVYNPGTGTSLPF